MFPHPIPSNSAGALTQTSLDELTVLPRILELYLREPTFKGRGRKGRKKEG